MPHLLPAAASAIAAAAPAAAAGAAKAGIMATLKSVAFKAITNLAISAAMSALQPQVGGQSGRTFEFVIDPDGPIPFAAGRVGVAGSVIHRDTFGPDLMYYGMPFVLSGAGPITAIESFMADDYPMSFDANGGATTEPYRQELFFRSVLGHQPAPAALTTPSGLKNGATLPGWTASHKLSGKAAGLIVMAENSKGSAFPTGEIKPLIQLLGLKGWDPTLDSTYPGGSGPCRLHDPSTWVTLTCPILWALKWSLGLWEGPNGKGAPQVDHQVGGIGAKLSGIDVPAFVAASNIAKANGWTVSAYPNTDDDKHQVLEAFLQAGGAIYSQRAGKISCISRAAPRASIVTISAADTAGPLEIDTAASRIDRINTIRPRFWSPAHRWQMTAMEEVTAASYQTEDGGKRTRGIDYPFVSDAKQAGQLAALQIANTREGIAGVIPLKPHLQRIRPGDAFTITEAGFVLNGLKCLCLNTDYDPATGVVRVSFVSETDAKYPFALGQDPTPPTPQVLTPVDPRYVTPPAPGDWTVTVPGPAPDGSQLPNIDLTGLVSNDTADALLISWRAVASGENPNTQPLYLDADGNVLPGWMDAGSYAPTIRSLSIQGPKSGAVVWLALRYRRGNNFSAAELKGPITVRTLVADVMPNAPGLSQIRSDIEAAFGDILDVSGRIDQTRADLDAADQNLVNAITGVDDKANQLVDLTAELEIADQNLINAIGGVDAKANQLVQLTAELENNKASVASLNAQVARIDGVEAVNAAQALALVDLENGKVALSEYNTLKAEVTSARDGAPSLLGQIQSLKSVDLDLQNNKASVASLNAQVARIDGVEAVNAAQALALVDLENGKVALSEYNTLKAEVTSARDGAPSLLGQIQSLKSVDLDLQNNKASVASLNAQVARIDGVEAVNAAQALALVDLENGKVALSEYNTLKGEVLSARDGAPSLLGKIQNLKSVDLDLQNNKASVASVEALTARTANTEADIIDLENALATESGARAEAIEQVAARSIILPGLTKNGDFRNGLTAYTQSGLGWIVGTSGGPGAAYAFCAADGQQDLWTDFYPVDTNLSFSFFGSRSGAGVSLNVLVEWWNSSTGFISYGTISSVPQGGFQRIIIENDARPTNANRFRMLARKLGMGGNVAFTLLKVNTGAYATPWSDDQDAKAVQASVTEQALAIIDLENNQALASFRKIAEASGGAPAYYEFVSSSSGGYAAIAGPVVALVNTAPGGGAPLVALEAVNGEVRVARRLYVGSGAGQFLIDAPNQIQTLRDASGNLRLELGLLP